MELTLSLPGLLLPDPARTDTLFDLRADGLSLLLGRGQRNQLAASWLPQAFCLTDTTALPAAALRKVGAGGTAAGIDGHWLCLDPVHWAVGREGITLKLTDVAADEAAALVAELQPLFADWGVLASSAPNHWELQLTRSLLLETRPLPDCIGRAIDPALPGGPDGAAWRRLLAEVQTCLHAHPVNRQREALGRLPINSLWPWGLGALPQTAHTDYTVVWCDDPVLTGLATLADIPSLAAPDRFALASGNVLCQLSLLTTPARTLDAFAWRNALLALEERWITPALAALKRGELSALRLIGGNLHAADHHVVISLVRGNLWRFWRRPAPLTQLA